jgi:hypothetical protein
MSDVGKAEALGIRDAALVIVRRIGKADTYAGKNKGRFTSAETDNLQFADTTPFTPQPAPPEAMRYALARPAVRSQHLG